MPKLKTTLLFKLLICFVVCWCLINIFLFKYSSKYVGNETNITGKIIEYSFNGNLLKMTVKAKEKIIVYYTIKKEEEKTKLEETLGFYDYVMLKGQLEKPLTNDIPNVFSYQKYLENQHIYYLFEANSLIVKPTNNFLYKIKNWFYQRMRKINNNEYLKALLLGVTEDIDYELFQENGLSHLFAISGMHISLFILILSKNKYLKNKNIIMLFLFFYSFLVGFTPSILRSVLFYSLKNFFSKRQIEITNQQILLIVISLMLFINPFYLYNLGFIYSFVISFGLLTFNFSKSSKLKNLFIISLFTFFISLPITAINNYKINFLTIFYNMIAIWYVSVILYPLALLTFILPIFNSIFGLLINIFIFFNKIISMIKIGTFVIPKVSMIVWLIYYYLFWQLFYAKHFKYSIYLVLFLLIIHFYPILNNSLNITYLSVGQGDSTLLVSPHLNKVVLIDTGGSLDFSKDDWTYRKSKNYTHNNMVTYINSLGINHIDTLILTHGDYDHAGNASSLIDKLKVKEVIFNNDSYNDLEQEIISKLNSKNIKYYQGKNYLNFGKNQLKFLNTKSYNNENDNSNVIYLNYNNYQFLFMGDAGITRESDLLAKYHLRNITFLKVGHHGSDTSSSTLFINTIKPQYSIISVGKNNRYGHPTNQVLNTLASSKIYRTDEDGSIIVKIKQHKLEIKKTIILN